MRLCTPLIALLLIIWSNTAARATDVELLLRNNDLNFVNVVPGSTFSLDVVYFGNGPLTPLEFKLNDSNYCGFF